MIDAPPVCGTLSDGAHMGGGLTGRTHTLAESCPCVARTLTQRMHKGFDSTLDSQTPIVTHGGVFDGEPTCFHPTQDTICSTDGSERGQAVAVRTANTGANGHGVADEVTHTIDQAQGQAIAFKPGQSEAAGGTFVTEDFTPTMQAQNNGSTAVPAVAYGIRGDAGREGVAKTPSADAEGRLRLRNPSFNPSEELCPTIDSSQPHAVAFTKAKRAQSTTDDESWVPGDIAPTQNQFDQGDTRATTVVAFTQNSRDEVRLINDDGNLAGALNAEGVMHQTNYLAFSPLQGGRSMPVTPESPTLEAGTGNKTPAVVFANRTRDGIKVPEVMKDGVVPALTNPGGGGRSDAVNVASAMQVRRLTPTECAYLQGFPADYLDITFRKKPAADGPKYRALGNSMAVPCMWWLGMRIDNATRRDIP